MIQNGAFRHHTLMTCVWWWLKSMILYCLGRKIRLWRKKKMRNTDRYKTNMTWIIYLPKKKKNSILLVSWTQCIRWFHIVLVLVLHDEREKYPFFFNWWQLNLRKTEKTLIHNNNFTKGGGGGGRGRDAWLVCEQCFALTLQSSSNVTKEILV